MPYEWAVVTGTLVIIVYTFLGGFLAVSWTDLIQGLLMAAALVLVPVMVITTVGGPSVSLQEIDSINPELLDPFTSVAGEPLGLIAILSLMGWGLGYFGQPHILARFKAIRTVGHVTSARRIAVSWSALTMLGAMAVGMTGIGFLDNPLQGADSEKIFMLLVGLLFHPLIAGILLAAILAAIMSSADSQLLVSSSAFTEDLYKTLFRHTVSEQELVWVGRIMVAVVALLACLLALNPDSKVLDLVAYAWAGFGAAFGPALILSLYWPRMNRVGALAGIISGGTGVVVWKQLTGGIFELYELVPAFIISFIAIIVFTLISSAPHQAVIDRHHRVTER
jgi:sodium/proline symporter